mgnify:CR=1 FL=1
MQNPKDYQAWKIFSNNIKWLREQCEFSEEKMAKILGISVDMLKKIECGELPKELNCEILLRIHIVFGIDASRMWEELS